MKACPTANHQRFGAEPEIRYPTVSAATPHTIGATMPKRSSSHPIPKPPTAKPSIASVNGNEASARTMPKSACTAGNATGNDHMPMPPRVLSESATAKRSQAAGDSVWSIISADSAP